MLQSHLTSSWTFFWCLRRLVELENHASHILQVGSLFSVMFQCSTANWSCRLCARFYTAQKGILVNLAIISELFSNNLVNLAFLVTVLAYLAIVLASLAMVLVYLAMVLMRFFNLSIIHHAFRLNVESLFLNNKVWIPRLNMFKKQKIK